jgi:hypothetical protein
MCLRGGQRGCEGGIKVVISAPAVQHTLDILSFANKGISGASSWGSRELSTSVGVARPWEPPRRTQSCTLMMAIGRGDNDGMLVCLRRTSNRQPISSRCPKYYQPTRNYYEALDTDKCRLCLAGDSGLSDAFLPGSNKCKQVCNQTVTVYMRDTT